MNDVPAPDAPLDVGRGDAESAGAPAPRSRRWSRRTVLGLAGGGIALAGVSAAGGVVLARSNDDDDDAAAADGVRPFYGAHQAGIVTPAQDRLHFAAFDVITTSRDELATLLAAWTEAAARMTQGRPAGPYGPVSGPYQAPPDDTGEALDLPASNLTITFGFGPSLFQTADGDDRFGLAGRRPDGLIELPHFPADRLDAARSDGDICVQACADDPQVAVHAVRNLARIGFGTVALRWSQLGFGRTSSTTTTQKTPRNLFGFKDGTANVKAEETDALDQHVWVAAADEPDAGWLAGGSYLIARRISMHIETWDRGSLAQQEAIIGRDKGEGAPLSGGGEFTDPDFEITGRDDAPLIAVDSHVRLAHPDFNGGVRLLRRGYNFADGSDGLGRMNAGLFFIAFVRSPQQQFVPMQTVLARDDALSEYLLHTGSAIFAIPAGVSEGQSIGDALFA